MTGPTTMAHHAALHDRIRALESEKAALEVRVKEETDHGAHYEMLTLKMMKERDVEKARAARAEAERDRAQDVVASGFASTTDWAQAKDKVMRKFGKHHAREDRTTPRIRVEKSYCDVCGTAIVLLGDVWYHLYEVVT